MPPRERLTREQKGKAVSTGLDPSTVSVTSSDNLRLLVIEAERLVRGEHDRDLRESKSRESEGNSADARTEGPNFYLTRYSPDGYFEKLPAVPAELLHSPDVEGQDWEKKLLRECGARGVTFLIPTYLERPWSPPVGYQCVYNSYFQPDTKLCFPIPRLITSQSESLSQFVNGSYRIVVVLMVLAAEIGVSMSVRAFKELTSLKAQPHGIFSVKMRPNYNILTGHPNKTPGWNRRYFFVKSDKAAFNHPPRDNFRVLWNCKSVDHPKVLDYPEGFFDNARAVSALSHQRWPDISEERIHRALARISEDDWETNLPCKEDPGKKRLQLFKKKEQAHIKRSKRMKELPDLSVLLDDELDIKHGRKRLRNDDSAQTVAEEVSTEDRPRKKKKKKSAENSQEGSVSRGEPITQLQEDLNRAVVHDQDVSSGEQLLRRGRKTPAEGPITRFKEELQIIQVPNEERVSPSGGDFTRHSSPQRPGDWIPTLFTGPKTTIQDFVEFSYAGDCLLIRDPVQFTELVRQIRSGSEFLPPVEDLMFREAYARAAHARLMSDGRMNLVVEKYDRALRDALVQLGQSEEALKEKEESRTFEVTQERIRVETAMITKCNRRFEKIREHQSRRDAYETARNLYGQASCMRKCLQKLIEQGAAIPQSMVDLFAVQERRLESEAASLEVGEIPEEDLCLSPLILPLRFLDECVLAELDPHGSNVDLVDSATIANLQAPSEPTDPVTGSFAAVGDVVGDVVASLQGTDAHAAEDACHRASA
ncbi:hypothetical protein N665_0532s0068 [Sinapis alba]|nr:hypothetical protein N665_0532s0068 [Sinapis alba]